MAVDLTVMRKLFEAGALSAARIVPVPMEPNTWELLVVRKDGAHEYVTVTQRKRRKTYKSLKAAQGDAARIGFRELMLQIA